MSLPRLPAKLLESEKVKSSILLDRLKKSNRAPKFAVPENILLYFSVREAPKWSVPFEKKNIFAARIDLLNPKWAILSGFGIGAPAMAFYVEMLHALGAKRFVALGQAGALSDSAKVGELILVEKALRDEGTSFHYLAPGEFSFPTAKLNERLSSGLLKAKLPIKNAQVWSTDAIFRETELEVKTYSQRGIAAVDMESSALFAVAHYRKIEAASVLVVSDELWGEAWNPQFANVSDTMQKAAEAIVALSI